MSAKLVWYSSSVEVENPFLNTAGTPYTFTLKNIGDAEVSDVGFYLVPSTVEGDVDFPSTEGTLADWYDVLTWGDVVGEGLLITQDATTESFRFGYGELASNAIPLTLGALPGYIDVGEEVTITFEVVPPGSVTARRLYIEVVETYTEV